MNPLNIFVGDRIRNFRKVKGWTQEEFAERARLQPSYIAGVERGERNITLDTLDKLISSLNISPSELFYSVPSESTNNLELLNEHITYLLKRDKREVELIHRLTKDILSTFNGE